jgi:hypothetical protein
MRDVALPMFVVAKTFEHPTQGADGAGRKMDCASSLSGSASCHIALPEKTLAKRKGRHFARSGNRLPYGLWPTGDLSSVAAMSYLLTHERRNVLAHGLHARDGTRLGLRAIADFGARLDRHRDRGHMDDNANRCIRAVANGTDSREINPLKTPVGLSP